MVQQLASDQNQVASLFVRHAAAVHKQNRTRLYTERTLGVLIDVHRGSDLHDTQLVLEQVRCSKIRACALSLAPPRPPAHSCR